MLSQTEFTLIEKDFFVEMFTEESLRSLLGQVPARAAFASKSPMVKKLGLNLDTLRDDELIKLMVGEPRLIRRTIVVIDDQIFPGARQSSLSHLLNS